MEFFLAAISSSRSDSVTKFVRPSVRSFVRSSPFCDSQVFLQLEAYYVKQAADYCFRSHILPLMNISKALKLQHEAGN